MTTVIEELLNRCVFEKMLVKGGWRSTGNLCFAQSPSLLLSIRFYLGHVRLYGSSVSKTAINCSDLNVTIDIPDVDCSDAVETMKRVAELLNSAAGRLNR